MIIKKNKLLVVAGWSLNQLLMAILIIGVLGGIALPLYQKSIKQTHLHEAYSALLTNSHKFEQHYQQQMSYQTKNKQWPKLLITQTTSFCIRPQGDPQHGRNDRYTLKAVAFDTENEPRILKINQHGNVLICTNSQNRCDDDPLYFFQGGSHIDLQCQPFHL